MLGRRRPVVRLQESQLGAKEADPVGARLERRAYLGGGRSVGENTNRPSVAGHRGQLSSSHRAGLRLAGGGESAPHCIHSPAVGRRDDHALTGIDDAGLTLDQRKHVAAEPDHHREPEPASHDGGVAGDAPDRECDAGHVAVQLDDVGRPEIRRDQDRLAGRCPASAAGRVRGQPRCSSSEAPHVRGPRRELSIAEGVELLRDGLDLDENRARRGQPAREHRVLHRLEQHRVLRHHGPGVDDVSILGPAVGSKLCSEVGELPGRLRQGVASTRGGGGTSRVIEHGPLDLAGSIQAPHPSKRGPR